MLEAIELLTKNENDGSSEIEARLLNIQRFITRIPSFSTTVAKVLEICGSPNAAASDLNRVISYDPVLTGQLIKLINSAYYGLPNRVTSLTRAIIMLGINTVKNMVLSTSVLARFNKRLNVSALTIDDFWQHSLGVAVIAKAIAKKLQVPVAEQEEYFVSGLMHDLGKIPLINCYPELYQQALDAANDSQSALLQAEIAVIGIDHCQVGYLIGAKWKLVDRVQAAILAHHEPAVDLSNADFRMWCITSLANQLARLFTIGYSGDADIDSKSAGCLADHLGIDFNALVRMKTDIELEIEKARIFLQVAA
jgi:putative nucleotidyltransferase with HDIG domain